MSVSANTGNAFLDGYARQINVLERDPNATPEYNAGLEAQFALIAAQILGNKNGGAASGNVGSGGGSDAPPATGPGGTATVADSVAKIGASAGPAAADAVKKIADGAATTIGGSAGAAVAASAAQAGADAAAKVIASGGTAAEAAAAAAAAAQAVVTAGATGDPDAAKDVAHIVAMVDPGTAQTVASMAANAAAAGGGAVGIAGAVTAAGTAAADFVLTSGGTAAAAGAAAIASAQAATNAGAAVIAAGGSAAEAAAAAASVAAAAGIGGAQAAQAVAAAAAVGGSAAAAAVLTVVQAGPVAAAGVLAVAQAVVNAGGSAAAAGIAAQAVANTAAGAATIAATRFGVDGGAATATAVARAAASAAQAAGANADTVAEDAISAAGLAARAASYGGPGAAQAVARALAHTGHYGIGVATDIVAATEAAFRSAGGAGGGTAALKVGRVVAQGAADAVERALAAGGAAAAAGVSDAVARAVQATALHGSPHVVGVTRIMTQAASLGGAEAVEDVADMVELIAGAHGGGEGIVRAAQAAVDAYGAGGHDAVVAAFDAAQDVIGAGGYGDRGSRVAQIVSLGTRSEHLSGASQQDVVAFAAEIAGEVRSAREAGLSPAGIINVAQDAARGPVPPYPGRSQVLTTSFEPPPLNPLGPEVNAYYQLLRDLENGADKATIEKDAQALAIIAGKLNDPKLEKVALLVGSGVYGDKEAIEVLKAASPELNRGDGATHVTDPLGGRHDPLTDAYLALEVDIANGADAQQIKTGADHVAQLAKDSGQAGLASAAANISNSISDHTYDQARSLTALMENPPTFAPTMPVPPLPSPEAAAYQKLLNDIQSGANRVTILADAAELTIAAAGAGDLRLEDVARNIGNSIGNGTYSADTSLSALKDAAPGTPGAQTFQGPQGAVAQATDTGRAFLKLEFDVAHGADLQTVRAEAEQVKSLAQRDGNAGLVAAADAIITGIDNGTYSQLGALDALMNNGATNVELGFSPTGSGSSSPDPDEQAAYQKLLTDIRSGADQSTIVNDVLSLFRAAIVKGDLGLAEVALDIGDAVKGNTYDPDKALRDLTNVAPGTPSAAQLPLDAVTDT